MPCSILYTLWNVFPSPPAFLQLVTSQNCKSEVVASPLHGFLYHFELRTECPYVSTLIITIII